MKIDGACHCGFITIEGDINPEKVTICHCTDCQTASSAPFRVSVPCPGETFKITGEPATYVKTTAESGNRRVQGFCPKCGTPVYSTSPGEGRQPFYMLRIGILSQRDQLMPKQQIWMRSAQPWVSSLADLPASETQLGTSHLR
jgi:hypothetical protein